MTNGPIGWDQLMYDYGGFKMGEKSQGRYDALMEELKGLREKQDNVAERIEALEILVKELKKPEVKPDEDEDEDEDEDDDIV